VLRGPKMLPERTQSKRALVKIVQGGFFLRKKPLGVIASGYSYSGFAIGAQLVMQRIGSGKQPLQNH